jgi:hypothetical protein
MPASTLTRLAALAMTVALSSACATHAIKYSNPKAAAASGTVHEVNQAFFLWGLAGGDEIDLDRMCPAGVRRIESRHSAGDQFLSLITVGIYSPMSVDVECTGGAASPASASR